MESYKLELLPSNPSSISSSQEKVRKMASEFADLIKERDKEFPQRVDSLETELFCIRYPKHWDVLNYLDKNQDARTRTRELYEKSEIQLGYTVAVNGAMLITDGPAPGFFRGHTNLLEMVANNTASMFASSITPKFRKKLVNGTFWESLSELSTQVNYGGAFVSMEGVLVRDFVNLDPSFTPKGLKIFNRYSGNEQFNLQNGIGDGLSMQAVKNYGKFVRKINDKADDLQLEKSVLKQLVGAYIEALEEERRDFSIIAEENPELLKEPWLRPYKRRKKLVA